MSAQTINSTSILSLFKEAEGELVKNTIKLLLEKRFKLGDGYDEEMQAHYLKIYNIISKNYCPLNEYLYLILREGVQSEDSALELFGLTKDKEIKPVDTLYQLWLSRGNIGTFDEFLDLLLLDNKANWDELGW